MREDFDLLLNEAAQRRHRPMGIGLAMAVLGAVLVAAEKALGG